MFICGNCQKYHALASEARACYAARYAPQPQVTVDRATDAQLSYIARLNGDASYARGLTKAAASSYIDRLKKDRGAMTTANNRTVTKIPLEMLKNIENGYYAMKSGDSPYRFYRVSRPKTGQFSGFMKIQSQHSEDYRMVLILRPNDTLYWYNLTCEDDILMLAVNQKACAVEYGQLIGRCCRCGKTLTDDRSRWYGIGPDCEEVWPHILDMVAEQKGDYVGA